MLTTANHLVLKMFSRRTCSITSLEIKGKLTSLSLPGYSSLLKNRAILHFLQSAGISSNYHDLLKIDRVVLQWHWQVPSAFFMRLSHIFHQIHCTCVCSVCLTALYLVTCLVFIIPNLYTGLMGCDSWGQILAIKTKVKKTLNILLILCHQVAFCVQQQSHIM